MLDFMHTCQNFLLKENLFSLKNLVEIYNGFMINYLENCLFMYKRHFSICTVLTIILKISNFYFFNLDLF